MTGAKFAQGTLLQLGDGATPTEVFTTVAEVRNASGPGLALDTRDVTSHSSPSGWEEHIGTLLRSGEVTFDINYIPANATHNNTAGLIFVLRSRLVRNFKLVLADGSSTTWIFPSLVTKFTPGAPVDGELTASVTLKLTGAPTLV